MNNEEKILEILTQIQGDISTLKGDVSALKDGQQRIEAKLTTIENQTARLTEYHTETKQEFEKLNFKFDTMSKDVTAVEYISGKNMADIANLKLAK